MGIKLDRLIKSAVTDNKVTRAEVDQLAAEVKSNGKVSKAEAKALKALLATHSSKFEPEARTALNALLGAGPQPPPPPPAGDAISDMSKLLADASAGGVDARELQAAVAAVTAKYGTPAARDALMKSLNVKPESLTLDAVGWLQGDHGKMEGHVARYQTVLTGELANAKLLDSNFDGKLDSNDLVFTADAAGKVNVQKLGDALRDKVKIGAAVIDSCEAMAAAGFSFVDITPQGWKQELPMTHFVGGPYNFTVKPGVKPSDALMELFKNPGGAVKFECGTAMKIVYLRSILDLIGPKDFDRVCKDMSIGPGYGTGMVPTYTESGSASTPSATGGNPMKPGERGYIANWDVSPQGRTGGWSGENVVYLGNGKYYGHPFGVETAEHMIAYMNELRNPGSTRPASHSSMVGGLGAGILVEDKEPG